MKTALSTLQDRFGRDRVLVAALLGGVALLVAEIRFEHREALHEAWAAYLPLAVGAFILLAGGLALLRWHRGGRAALQALFALALVTGLVGLWLHSGGHPVDRIAQVLSAWSLAPGQNGGVKMGSQPPALAPAAFIGLGILGLLAASEAPPAA